MLVWNQNMVTEKEVISKLTAAEMRFIRGRRGKTKKE
jgi:hypothetical protein